MLLNKLKQLGLLPEIIPKESIPREYVSKRIPDVEYKLPIPETTRGLCTGTRYIETTYKFIGHKNNVRAIEHCIYYNEDISNLFRDITEEHYIGWSSNDNLLRIEFAIKDIIAIRINITFHSRNQRRIQFLTKDSNGTWNKIYEELK